MTIDCLHFRISDTVIFNEELGHGQFSIFKFWPQNQKIAKNWLKLENPILVMISILVFQQYIGTSEPLSSPIL